MPRKPAEQTELATTEANEVAPLGGADLAAYGMEADVPAPGTENIGAEDIELPRIRLIQGLSKECAQEDPGSEGFRAIGTLVHSGNDNVLLPYPNEAEKLTLLPLTMLKQRIWFEDGKMVARSSDAVHHSPDSPQRSDGITVCKQCPSSQWVRGEDGAADSPPKCGIQYVYPSLIVEEVEAGRIEDALVALTLAKTSAGEGRSLNTAIGMSGLPFYAFPLEVTTWKDTNDKGTFGLFTVRKRTRLAADSELYLAGRTVFNMIKNVSVTVEVDDSMAGDFHATAPTPDGAGDSPAGFEGQF